MDVHKQVVITFDPKKRDRTLRELGLDFADAAIVFAGETLDIDDDRFDCGEPRTIAIGHLRGRMVVVVWTPRDADRHVIILRKAHERERKKYW
jgi:uncharacterized DUF497 family protein